VEAVVVAVEEEVQQVEAVVVELVVEVAAEQLLRLHHPR